MKILIAHNYYQQPGGEDSCVAAETALLEGHGHEVIRYCVHNNAIDAMSRPTPSGAARPTADCAP
jgi:hypothetical protein